MSTGFGAEHHGCPTNTLEAAAGKTLTRAQVEKVIAQHGCEGIASFDAKFGVRPTYSAEGVFLWLGY